jgi:hypothetical protein
MTTDDKSPRDASPGERKPSLGPGVDWRMVLTAVLVAGFGIVIITKLVTINVFWTSIRWFLMMGTGAVLHGLAPVVRG